MSDDEGTNVDTGFRMRDLRAALLRSVSGGQRKSNMGLKTPSGASSSIKRHVQFSVTAEIACAAPDARSPGIEEITKQMFLAIMEPDETQQSVPLLSDPTSQQDPQMKTLGLLMKQNNSLKTLYTVFKTNGATLLDVQSSSIVFKLQITSSSNLEAFWNSYKGGRLQSELQEILITKDLERKAGCNLNIQLHMDEKDYLQGLEHFNKQELRLVLVGRTGTGKSTTGNHILMKYKKDQRPFATAVGGSSKTDECNFSSSEILGRPVVVVDTPGLFDTERKNTEVLIELARFLCFTQPGPHAIILVMKARTMTQEIQQTVRLLVNLFEEGVYSYMIVLFTGKDDMEENNTTFEEFLQTIPPFMRDIINKCGDRCIAFDNIACGDKNIAQVDTLLQMIEDMVQKNGGGFYEFRLQKELVARVSKSTVTSDTESFREAAKNEKPNPGGWFWEAMTTVASFIDWEMWNIL